MAVDKLVDSNELNSGLTAIANAIRAKGGTSAQLSFPTEFVSAINAIPTGGGSSGGEPTSIQVYLEQDEDGYLMLTDTALIPSAGGVYF